MNFLLLLALTLFPLLPVNFARAERRSDLREAFERGAAAAANYEEPLRKPVLEALLRQADQIVLTQQDGTRLPTERQLSSLLAAQLAGINIQVNQGTSVFRAPETKVSCTDVTGQGMLGARRYECDILFKNDEYLEEGGGVRGPTQTFVASIRLRVHQPKWQEPYVQILSTNAVLSSNSVREERR